MGTGRNLGLWRAGGAEQTPNNAIVLAHAGTVGAHAIGGLALDVTVLEHDIAVLAPDSAVLEHDVAGLEHDVEILEHAVRVLEPDGGVLEHDGSARAHDEAVGPHDGDGGTYGHQKCSAVGKKGRVASTMRMAYRIGGEAFSILVDGIEEAAAIAERLQRTEGAKCAVPVAGEGDPLCTAEEARIA